MHDLVSRKRKEIASLCRHYDVARLEVFGSAARSTDFNDATSEVDFVVEFNPHEGVASFNQFFGLVDDLRRTLGRPVDLVESCMIKNLYLRKAIDASRELVYES